MLQHLPAWLGHLLAGVHAGTGATVIADPALNLQEGRITLSSPAFAAGAAMPVRSTADGEGVSPPLAWHGVPAGTVSLVLVVEDAGAPTREPLVHAIVVGIDPTVESMAEAAIGSAAGARWQVGHNSFGRSAWLPPDPPPGHGNHTYVFQLFALDTVPDLATGVGRTAVVAAIKGRVLGTGVLLATYGRDR